ncbi:Alpha/Beta hydrolase protein [Durotheca rogersii]|uniref:Alpha/Beta hydrolase protein n=1 Tax=Durotheca rogersii TaxID=419775 RepID=UPI00221FBE8B|nr:Alpha/Beta hydrolase protein [Durotheca rogersii]KAI5867468.1 Alpha/Beta hydrolase protein [Durotheca rogersii]
MSIFEKLAFVVSIGKLLVRYFANLLSDIVRPRETLASTLYRHVQYTKVRAITDSLSIRQIQAISPPTDDVYLQLCKRYLVSPESVILEDGTHAHWIGPSSARKVIINFHGGGYVLPASEFMMDYMFRLQALVSSSAKPVAILFLSYDLSPAARYPRQLTQAVALLRHVVEVLHKAPEDIILTGDSAGGNLALALLSHISSPHPAIPPLRLASKLRGLVLVSPWVSFRLNEPSCIRNARKDLLSIATLKRWAEAFMGTPSPHTDSVDCYNQPVTAPAGHWKDLMAEEVLILGGEDEVLLDSIVQLSQKMDSALGPERVTVLITEGEAHDMPSLDLQFGLGVSGEQAKRMGNWIARRV